MRDATTIEESTPDRLVVRHRAGRAQAHMFFVFGILSAVFATMEPGTVRWAAGTLAVLNIVVAWVKYSQTTITFDRRSGEVLCAEQRPFFGRRALLPLEEFTGAQIKQASGNTIQTRLGLATRKGVFIPIEPSFTPGVRNVIANAIDDWLDLGGKTPDAPGQVDS